ncbi:uncharacterized protein BXZ73DRAFT_81441 [Epithele typhae]|uniref:uncharacterized protein n=1 Tax=Epithele typhae TaxID=378194 RepID=UPI002007E4E1|nr:uncharacterized protein BXZ73DRAFT_81441 [Epithele typhae]KAH9915183.1 hypothetical protein BXZ73DRAFT_81441 [Epithele typhae]
MVAQIIPVPLPQDVDPDWKVDISPRVGGPGISLSALQGHHHSSNVFNAPQLAYIGVRMRFALQDLLGVAFMTQCCTYLLSIDVCHPIIDNQMPFIEQNITMMGLGELIILILDQTFKWHSEFLGAHSAHHWDSTMWLDAPGWDRFKKHPRLDQIVILSIRRTRPSHGERVIYFPEIGVIPEL